MTEKDYIFDKSVKCAVCQGDFKTKTLKTGKARMLEPERDLRPRYDGIDVVKYDAIVCPYCGYAAVSRCFHTIGEIQRKRIREKIGAVSHVNLKEYDFYTYDDAIERYKMALLCAEAKAGKASEVAFTSLKLSWVYRGKKEGIPEFADEYKALTACENEYQKMAYEFFKKALSEELFPICGMDENTMNYLLAVLAIKFDEITFAKQNIGKILISKAATPRMKDKARLLKDELI